MRKYRLTVCLVIYALLLLLFLVPQASAQDYFQYNVQIKSDGSAVWTVTQFSSVNTSVDAWEDFQERIFNLLDSAANVTHREMAIDENSLEINTTISSESKTTEYTFAWQNFSIIQGSELSFGDVFQVNNFFSQLYGDAALQLSYPNIFSIKSVYPPPYERQDSSKTLRWSRTQDLDNSQSSIILTSNGQNEDNNSLDLQQYAFIGAVSTVGIALSLLAFFIFKHRKSPAIVLTEASPVESEEDKVIKLLNLHGGSMRQSEITEQCSFSKAKTSQLLTSLEKRGNITRYKKGRDKIVTLKERVSD